MKAERRIGRQEHACVSLGTWALLPACMYNSKV